MALTLYITTLAPTVLEADSGEFQFVTWLPAIAHPTGYPLYTLLGWLWTHSVPFGEVAWRLNLFSAIWAAGAVGLTYAIAKQLLQATMPDTASLSQQVAAILAAVIFAVSQTFWSQAIIAEVYSLHIFLITLLLWLALKYRQINPALAFTFGLSLTHHITAVLFLPALSLFFILGIRDKGLGIRNQESLVPYPLSLIPLLLYLYLPLIAPTVPYRQLTLSSSQVLTLYDNSWFGLWQHLTGSAFRGELRPYAIGTDRFLMVGQAMWQQVGWTGIILAIMGLFILWQSKRVELLALTSLAFLIIIAFNLIYFIGDIFVLFIPAWLMVCLWIGIGSLGITRWLAHKFVQRRMTVNQNFYFRGFEKRLGQNINRLLTTALLIPFFLLPTNLLISQFPMLDQSQNTATRDRWQQILSEPLPHGAILLSNDRDEIMPLWYYQYVEGRRPDLLGLFPLIVPDPKYTNIGHVLDQALQSRRPVYLIKPMDGLRLKANLTPTGTLFLATPIQQPLIFLNPKPESIMLFSYDHLPDTISKGTPFTATLYWQTSQPLTIDYSSYVHLINEQEQGITQSDHRPGGEFYPSHYWQVGEVLRDSHTLTIPTDAPPGKYRLRVGWYHQPKPGQFIELYNLIIFGQITIK